ncbi:MAG TPA: DUF4271 domain-containing protein [Chitinophagaceae bacterium]|nr:DUF4271 domain-containing protein [Chitinophagaceae bacterium]
MKYILFLWCLLFAWQLTAQVPAADTARADSAVVPVKPTRKPIPPPVKKDSLLLAQPVADTVPAVASAGPAVPEWPFEASSRPLRYKEVIRVNALYNFEGQPLMRREEERAPGGKDALFYLLTGLLFFFALIKLLFGKYLGNLTGLVFRGSLRQKQIREQLLQTPLPSLFLNIFFVIVAGLYIFFLLQHYKAMPGDSFWLLLLYCVLAVALVYLVKFVMLKFTGWIFNIREAADTYIFIVFLVNKLLAIFLLPLLFVMTFSLPSWGNVLLTLSYVMVGGFFAYRYIVSFAPVRREVKVSQFHFFMYLCAFELVPLLLIYKILLGFF